MFVFISI